MLERITAKPPASHLRICGMHWLRVRDCDGHDFGFVALQWNPGSQTWSHSNDHGTGSPPIETEYWQYVEPIPYPNG